MLYFEVGRSTTRPFRCAFQHALFPYAHTACDAGGSRCLDAFAVILTQAFESGAEGEKADRLVSTLSLQLVSLEFCRLCRSVPTLFVRVDVGTPHRLWSAPGGGDQAGLQQRRARDARARAIVSRVPNLAPLAVSWMLPGVVPTLVPAEDELSKGMKGLQLLIARATRRVGGIAGTVRGGVRMQEVSWPASLRYLHFAINLSINGVLWPASLQHISFGDSFNQPIAEVAWPASLQQLSFGYFFDQPIVGVAWPASLKKLSFGGFFDQHITGVVWPAFLEQLSFGDFFNRPIAGVLWPASLQQLSFGVYFNQQVTGVAWPACLQGLSFGNDFNQPITGVVWPPSLQQLTFGHCFNAPVARAVFPASLQQLSFGDKFNQPIVEVAWPTCLQQLTIGRDFNQRTIGIEWPVSLRRVTRRTADPL